MTRKSIPGRARFAVFCIGLVTGLAVAGPCRDEAFEGNVYIVCSFDPSQSEIRMFWRDEGGTPYRTFPALAGDLSVRSRNLVFAMNAGMYQSDYSPLGLYVENGVELRSANSTTLDGAPAQIPNFYKKPNGVFYLGNGAAGVLETSAFLRDRPRSEFATQSGPMLVIDGRLHPMFIAGSTARNVRNGVGVSGPTEVHFVMTRNRVNFHDFARFFRDGLGCDNALYLDGGSASGVYAPALGRNDPPGHGGYGPIIAVVE